MGSVQREARASRVGECARMVGRSPYPRGSADILKGVSELHRRFDGEPMGRSGVCRLAIRRYDPR